MGTDRLALKWEQFLELERGELPRPDGLTAPTSDGILCIRCIRAHSKEDSAEQRFSYQLAECSRPKSRKRIS